MRWLVQITDARIYSLLLFQTHTDLKNHVKEYSLLSHTPSMPFFRLSTYKADKNHRSIIDQKWIGRVILDFSNEHTSDYHPCDLVQSIRTSHHLHTLKRFF